MYVQSPSVACQLILDHRLKVVNKENQERIRSSKLITLTKQVC